MEHPFLIAVKRETERLTAGRDDYVGAPKYFHHMGHLREVAFPWLSDIDMAGEVRMLMRDNPLHEAILCAGRDRILHLSEEVARLRAALAPFAELGSRLAGNNHEAAPITSCFFHSPGIQSINAGHLASARKAMEP